MKGFSDLSALHCMRATQRARPPSGAVSRLASGRGHATACFVATVALFLATCGHGGVLELAVYDFDSDVDMLVLVPDRTRRQDVLDCIYQDVHSAEVPFDVLVATPSIIERHRENLGLIYREILRTGRVVYAA